MPRTKAKQPNSGHSSLSPHTPAKGTKARQQTLSYQPFYLWVSFLWSLMTLGIMSQRMGVQAQGLPATLDLASVMATQGTVIQGAMAGDQGGYSIASAGDVNGDNITDLLVGAYLASPVNRSHAGTVYVIYGSRPLSAVLDLNALTAAQGIVIQGAVAGDNAGISVSTAGDVNGDGLSDLLVGAFGASPLNRTVAGAVYLIYGSRTFSGVLDLEALTQAQGMVIQGAGAGDEAGFSVSGARDVNGDGIADLLIGAWHASPLNRAQAGAVYLIYGARSLPPVLDLNTTLTQTQGMVIQGPVAGDFAGNSVANSGDVNGDGLSDLLVGAYFASTMSRSYAGAAYLIYGSRTLPAVLDLSTITATQGMVLQGATGFDETGNSVASAGDVNGDGITDLLVGAWQASPLRRTNAGAVILIYGSKTLPAVLDLKALTATQGMVIQGAVAGDYMGISVASAGDVNGDDIPDILVGAYLASPLSRSQAGSAYLIYGTRVLPATLDLANFMDTQGRVIQGAMAGDYAGIAVASSGDVNGDGLNDVLVGTSSVNRSSAGAAYLIYGKLAPTSTSLMTTPSTHTTTVAATSSIRTSPSTSAQSETVRESGESTTMVTEAPIPTISSGKNSGVSGTVIGAAAGAGGLALAAYLVAIGFYACRRKPGSTKSRDVALHEAGSSLRNNQNYTNSQLSDSHSNDLQGVVGPSVNGEYGFLPNPHTVKNDADYQVGTIADLSGEYGGVVNVQPLKDSDYQVGSIANLEDEGEDEKRGVQVGTVYSVF
jgi:hypothetical protein